MAISSRADLWLRDPRPLTPLSSLGSAGCSSIGSRSKAIICSSKNAAEASPASYKEFKLSDFSLCPHVSIGLSGRSDELLFEGVVQSPSSDLKGMRVVLRQLTGARAQRRGKRALEIVSKLICKQDIFHSYATRVHGFIPSSDQDSLTLVHGYYGCSLHQWLLCVDWLPNLEQRLALGEEAARRVGDHTTGGPEVTRQLRLVRMIMRDILIGVNYLHSQGLAHTELRLNNIHISAADRHVKASSFPNAVEFSEVDDQVTVPSGSQLKNRRKQIIAYDIRCVGYVMARMVLRELMDPLIFSHFKTFLRKGHDPVGLREFLLPHLLSKSPSGSTGLQILDRDGGAGWNLLAAMLAIDPGNRISCTDALRHPFLCGPRWPVNSSIDMIRWSLGSAAIRIVEEYIYMTHQRNRLAQLIDLLERVNFTTRLEDWMKTLPGKWRLIYHTSRQIGLTMRQASPPVLIKDVMQTISVTSQTLASTVDVTFTVLPSDTNWPHDKSGNSGRIQINATNIQLRQGERLYQTDTEVIDQSPALERLREVESSATRKRKGLGHFLPKDAPKSLPIIRLDVDEFDIGMELEEALPDADLARRIVQEVRLQLPKEIFAVSKLACATYVDSRLLVLRGITGAALLFIRSPMK
ncbi:hypothetical protein SELMODRAFT_113218 [Selaginella moellendorffii]|uniref:Protein kinase domain-containing protein n=1 Tax=Selaginella moellendorffii TaxID=88036 RepID=D8SB70_SELML|nr:hypothetical protein SELMODRAFT_113218 [Selaginella moellendorffii]